MTVQELIDHLQTLNPSAKILVADDDGNEFSINEVSSCEDKTKVFIGFTSV